MPSFDDLWDYADPAGSEARFRALLSEHERAADPAVPDERLDDLLQLLTQVARAQGLRRDYAAAEATLDQVDAALAPHPPEALAAARTRAHLERGRCFNDERRAADAIAQFERAWHLALAHGLDYHAVDAAHMLGIVHAPAPPALEWNERAVARARASPDPRARRWLASLLNNIGWTYHDLGRYADALPLFEQVLALRVEQGKPVPIRHARYGVAKTFRLLGRIDEALAIQLALLAECESAGQPDGYVNEEVAECILTSGRPADARPHFARAHELLSADAWLAANEPARLDRLKRLAAAG